jgi:hypothetical protein
MLSMEDPERHDWFAAEGLPDPSIRMFRTCYLILGHIQLHPLIAVESIRRASSASTKTSPCAGEPVC